MAEYVEQGMLSMACHAQLSQQHAMGVWKSILTFVTGMCLPGRQRGKVKKKACVSSLCE